MSDDLAALGAERPPVAAPREPIPAGACDCHGHVFARPQDFPLAPGKPAPVAPVELFALVHDGAGIGRAVIVQPSSYAFDNRALVAAVASAPATLRGIAVPSPEVDNEELAELAAKGISGVRFISIGRPFAAQLVGCSLDFEDLARIGPKLARHGLHANIWGDPDRLVDAAPLLTSLDCPIVLDHMAGAQSERGSDDPAFATVLELARDHGWWVKLCPIRVSRAAPSYDDARPFHDALVRTIPDRLLWCSDWPFLGLADDDRPTIGALLDLFRQWTPDDALRSRILVDNPATLYGF